MGSPEQNDNQLFQNSISYLHNISSLNFNPPTLKCLHLTKARLMELRRNIHLPSKSTRTTTRCQRCFLNLIDGPASYRIQAEEKKSRFARKMLAKIDRDKPMTKFQRKYIKRLNKFNGNQLAITCKFCKKESLVKLEKPKKVIRSKAAKTSQKRKKRIKKRDKFCGLKQDVVLSVTPENVKNKVKTLSTVKKAKLKNNDNFCELDDEVRSTAGTNRSFDTSDFIPLSTGNTTLRRFKLSKKENLEEIAEKKVLTKVDIRKKQSKLKKKSKLKEFLNTSKASKSSPSANLKQFLQCL